MTRFTPHRIITRMEMSSFLNSTRNGMVMVMPLLIIGAFSQVFLNFPVSWYQEFLSSVPGSVLAEILHGIYNATIGIISIYITCTISLSYAQLNTRQPEFMYGPPLTAVACFLIVSGAAFSEKAFISFLGVKGIFSAVFSAVISSYLYTFFSGKLPFFTRVYSDGEDSIFVKSIRAIVPATITMAAFSVFTILFIKIFNVSGFQEFTINVVNSAFKNVGNNIFTALFYLVVLHLFWFFGIHGSYVLEEVTNNIFLVEASAVSASGGTLINKTFFDVFVYTGGCGSTLCLLIALILFSRWNSNKRLARTSFFPIIFNINEIMVFGLPLFFNFYFIVPFIAVPLVSALVSYLAIISGLIPPAINPVEWTTPVFVSGWLGTGTFYAVLIQILNLTLGVLIYKPFVKLFDKQKELNMVAKVNQVVGILKESEAKNEPVNLTGMPGFTGNFARSLSADLEKAIENRELEIYYQPQFDNNNECIGVEALLRWNHKIFGFIYPPLIIKIAQETGLIHALEKLIFKTVIDDIPQINEAAGKLIKISINISANTIPLPEFETSLQEITNKPVFKPNQICIEVTEQTALIVNEKTEGIFSRISDMGFLLAIDDFSMGHTTLSYLQSRHFDFLKLDGSLVTGMAKNPRFLDIIGSIMFLSKSLGFKVIAEFVETENQVKQLENMGCVLYQGYLFSPAVPISRLSEAIKAGEHSREQKKEKAEQKRVE